MCRKAVKRTVRCGTVRLPDAGADGWRTVHGTRARILTAKKKEKKRKKENVQPKGGMGGRRKKTDNPREAAALKFFSR
jgi:hypothetical protein